MKRIILIVSALTFLLTGPALAESSGSAPLLPKQDAPATPAGGKVAAKAHDDASETSDALPNVPLSRQMLFRLLTADIAYQRGHWKTAYSITMRLAKQTRDPRLARRAAEIAISAKQTSEALAAVRLWRDLAPHSEDATKYYLGFVLISDKLAEAKPILVQRLKEASPRVRALLMFQIQRLLAGLKDKPAAFALLEELLAPYKDTAEAHIALAHGALDLGDKKRAQDEANRAIAIKPDSELGALTLAQTSGDADAAMRALANFITAHPKAREVRLAYARILTRQKKYDEARVAFEGLLALQPQDSSVLYALGLLSVQAKDAVGAERYLTQFIDSTAKDEDNRRDPAQIYILLAQMADERGDDDVTLKWLSKIEVQPDHNALYISAQIKIAQIYAKRKNLGEARKRLAKAEADNGDEQVALILAEAQIMRDADDPQEAFAILQVALKRFPENTNLLYDFAMAAEKINHLALMESTLRKVIKIAPKNALAYNALGYSLADRNLRLPEAAKLIEKANHYKPNDAYIMDSMGWVQFRLGKNKEAEDWLRRAYKIRSEAEIAVHLGEVLWVTGRKDEAKELWRAATKIEPKNETLINTLKRLGVSL